jgi:type I restriction enzyme S subunit
MSKDKNKLIPELRFPEFAKDGRWKEKIIEHVAKVTTGNKDTQNKVDNGKYPFFVRSQSVERINSYSFDGEAILTSGDGVGVGKNFHYIKGKFDFHQRVYCIYDFAKEVSGQFVFMYFSQHFYERVMRMSAKNSVDSVRMAMITEMPVCLPSKNEQKKIASCLSSLDELITAHSQKLELLKDHKKGLMQNLFPQEGETVPKYRFPEFVNDGEWVEKKLGDLGHFLGGGTPERSNSDYWTGDIPWISSSDISEDDIHNISITRFINENAVKQSATKIIPNGSILFVSRVGVGKLAINKHELCTSQDFTSFVPDSVLNYFIGYYFSANKQLLQSLNQGTSIKGFSKSDLESFILKHPQKIKEQQKIASFFSSLDEVIKEQSEKIEQLKLHKKGLMQGLFPKVID